MNSLGLISTNPVTAFHATYRYDPFGVTVEASGPLAATNPSRYTGACLDATGLYKLGERYYDPQHGRFTQQDPVVSPADPMHWNRYIYVGNNPINYTDPTGMFGCTVSLAGVTGAFTFTELLMVVGETVLGFKAGESLASNIFHVLKSPATKAFNAFFAVGVGATFIKKCM